MTNCFTNQSLAQCAKTDCNGIGVGYSFCLRYWKMREAFKLWEII